MNKQKIIKILHLITAVIFIAIMIACSNNFSDEERQLDNSKKITLTMAVYSSRYDIRDINNNVLSAGLPDGAIFEDANSLISRQHRDAVAQFNKSNSDYEIQLTDYADFNTKDDVTAGLNRLITEIISGKIPDIIEVSQIPFYEWANKSLFTNLYPFIDSDPSLSRNDFIRNIFRVAEADGKLYHVFPSFNLIALCGSSIVLGQEVCWDINEFMTISQTYPVNDNLISGMTKTGFLRLAIENGIEDYINRVEGIAYFDSPDFIQLLKMADMFRNETDPFIENYMIMLPVEVNLNNLSWNKYYFGEDYVFKSIPNISRKGLPVRPTFSYAISENCAYKETAWSFVREFLSEDWQLENVQKDSIPTNRNVFNERVNEAISEEDRFYLVNGIKIAFEPITQGDIDKIEVLFDSISSITAWSIDESLWTIINEEASDFFIGVCSAEVAAYRIQNKVAIYLAERN